MSERSNPFASLNDPPDFAPKPRPVRPVATEAIDRINELKGNSSLLIHTGDVSHLSRAAQFDTAEQIIRRAGLEAHFVPGEHDVLDQDGKTFFDRFTKGADKGYYSFDQQGVHFIGLNNVQDLKAGGLGNLGDDQLEWLEDDVRGRSSSQPIVVFAHVPLWVVYKQWGWGTADGAQALSYLDGSSRRDREGSRQ